MKKMTRLLLISAVLATSGLTAKIATENYKAATVNAYYTTLRMIKAGAKGILLGNEKGEGWKEYEPVLKAAVKACKDTDCIVVARNNNPLETDEQLEDCISYLNNAVALGAEATMACGLCRTPRAKELAKVIG